MANLPLPLDTRDYKNIRHIIPYVIALLLGLCLVLVFSRYVPWNMDEFSFYHNIICHHYPLNALNIYLEACSQFDLNILGRTLPIRSYYYTGVLRSLLYYPLFILLPSPISARFFGFLALMLQAKIIGSHFRLKWQWVLLGLIALFPYSFAHIVDTGPIAYHTTSVFVVYWLLNAWAKELRMRYALLAAVVAALGVWVKLSGLWLLPAFAIVGINLLAKHNRLRWPDILAVGIELASACIVGLWLLYIYIFASAPSDPTELPLLEEVLQAKSYTFSTVFSALSSLDSMRFIFHPLEAVHRVLIPRHIFALDMFFAVTTLQILPVGIFYITRKHGLRKAQMPLCFFLTFCLTLLSVAFSQRADSIHHIVLALPFLILGVLYLDNTMRHRSHRVFVIWEMILLTTLSIHALYFVFLPTLEKHNDAISFDNSVVEALRSPELARKYVYVVSDWGLYYLIGLYGDKQQSVIHVRDVSQGRIAELEGTAEKYNRALLFLYKGDRNELTESLSNSPGSYLYCTDISHADDWNIAWQKTSNSVTNLCRYVYGQKQ